MIIDYDSGIYLLEIILNQKRKIRVGRKGIYLFPAGYYYYVGSAQKNLQARLKRHQRREKKLHWHIDYLLAKSQLRNIVTWPVAREGECRLAEYIRTILKGRIIVPGFGSGDCHCSSHLFYFEQPLCIKYIGSDLFEF
jgi:Uri superfamily endonuclease